jgi:hypothetical protein
MTETHKAHISARLTGMLPVSLCWRGVSNRRFCQALRGCAPETALASCQQSAGCDIDSSAAWALGIEDLNDLFLIKEFRT